MRNHLNNSIGMSTTRFSKVSTALSILLGTIIIVGVTTVGLAPQEPSKNKTPEKVAEKQPTVAPPQKLQHSVILPPPPGVSNRAHRKNRDDGIEKVVPVLPLKPTKRVTVAERQKPKRITPRIPLKRDEFASALITRDIDKVNQPLRPLKRTFNSIRKQERSVPEIKPLKPRKRDNIQKRARWTESTSTNDTRQKHRVSSVAGQGVTSPDNKNYKKTIAKGRVLLRMLEHGRGPTIDIAWPETPSQRSLLFRSLRDCYGMTTSLLVNAQNLYSMTGPPGHPWKLNLDKFSGFLRSPIGQSIPEERQVYLKIAARHNLSHWKAVRIFPRTVDAVLLRGLQKLIGHNYSKASRIRAYYVIERSGAVILNRIAVDGNKMSGSVKIRPVINSGCRA